MKIGKAMRKLREINHLTQEEMAEKLNMTTNGYTQIEHDITNPNLPKIEKIAKIFDMTTLEFLDFCENGATFYISSDVHQNHDNSSSNQYIFGKQGHETLLAELQKAQLEIQYKDELLAEKEKRLVEKEREINSLRDIIEILKKA